MLLQPERHASVRVWSFDHGLASFMMQLSGEKQRVVAEELERTPGEVRPPSCSSASGLQSWRCQEWRSRATAVVSAQQLVTRPGLHLCRC